MNYGPLNKGTSGRRGFLTKGRNSPLSRPFSMFRKGRRATPGVVVTTPPSLNGALLVVGATLTPSIVAGSYVWPGGAVSETWAWFVDDVAVAGSYAIQPGDAIITATVTLSAAGLPPGTSLPVGPYGVQNSAPATGDTSSTVVVAAGTGAAPSAMAAPTLTTTATRVTITKGADGFNGGSVITDYDYRTSTDGGTTWSAWAALSSPQAVPGFTPGATNIVAQTRANNTIGKGAAGTTSAAATMKVVTFVGYAKASGTGANVTIDLTAALLTDTGGIGGAIQQTDVLILGAAQVSTTVDIDMTVISSGWTKLVELFQNSTRSPNLSLSWKAMGAVPDTSIVCPGPNLAASAAADAVLVYRYVDPTTPLDVAYVSASHSAKAAGSALCDPPAITPVSPGAAIVTCVAASGDTSPSNLNPPPTVVHKAHSNLGGTSRGIRLNFSDKLDWTTGAFDPAAWNTTKSVAGDGWLATIIALKPW